MLAQLPIECWQDILREAIFVPVFFDDDPAETYGIQSLAAYTDATPYWESERTRNALRRVCSSWNTFLKRFDHRFIHTPDIQHNLVPIDARYKAIRINIGCCFGYRCISCTAYQTSPNTKMRVGESCPSHFNQQKIFSPPLLQNWNTRFPRTYSRRSLPNGLGGISNRHSEYFIEGYLTILTRLTETCWRS